jgi:hypothetical protein
VVERFAEIEKMFGLDREAGLLGEFAAQSCVEKFSRAATPAGEMPQRMLEVRIAGSDQQDEVSAD